MPTQLSIQEGTQSYHVTVVPYHMQKFSQPFLLSFLQNHETNLVRKACV